MSVKSDRDDLKPFTKVQYRNVLFSTPRSIGAAIMDPSFVPTRACATTSPKHMNRTLPTVRLVDLAGAAGVSRHSVYCFGIKRYGFGEMKKDCWMNYPFFGLHNHTAPAATRFDVTEFVLRVGIFTPHVLVEFDTWGT